jgi:hypothetical protein
VLPEALRTPAALNALRQAAVAAKISVSRLRIGRNANSFNPRTGAAEFAAAPPTNPPHVNERPVDYATPDAAIDAFRKSQWYPRLQGKADAGEFVGELLNAQDGKSKYNSVNPGYGQFVQDMINTTNRRLPIWEQRP